MLGANFIELVKWSAQYFRLSWVEGCCYIGSWERIKIWNLEFGISSSVIFLVTPKKKNCNFDGNKVEGHIFGLNKCEIFC